MPLIILIFLGILFFPLDAFAADSSYWSELVFFIRTQQQQFHRELAGAIRAVQDGGVQALWAMVGISFLYGVFHAAGPGHGKAVIGTYLLSHASRLRKGILLSFAAAFVQGISAIVLVQGMVGLVGWSSAQAKDSVPILEMFSFGLIALIGIILMKRSFGAFFGTYKASHDEKHHHDHHDHSHEHTHNHEHHHSTVCTSCGHSHAPNLDMLDRAGSLKEALAIVISVGIRPCSGSVLMLIFAQIIGLTMAGIAAVFAISLGTAITVSTLAVVAVYFRKAALYLSARQNSLLLGRVSLAFGFTGGLVIAALGVSLLFEASQSSHPLF